MIPDYFIEKMKDDIKQIRKKAKSIKKISDFISGESKNNLPGDGNDYIFNDDGKEGDKKK